VLNRLAADFRRRTGDNPQSWNDLIRARLIRGTPLDPTGTAYTINPVGEIDVDRSSQLFPLPTEPSASPELQNASAAPR